MCDVTAQTRYTYAMQRSLKQANKDTIKHSEPEADSGIGTTLHDKLRESFSNFSVSRRSSACSAQCPSTYASIPASSGVESAPVSVYSSAASSCCESETCRLKSGPETARTAAPSAKYNHNNNNNCTVVQAHLPVDFTQRDATGSSLKLPSTPRASGAQSRPTRKTSSASSTKSDHSVAEESRRLVDTFTNTVYEKKRLLGKGGFARVYEVVQIGGDEGQQGPCAAKIIDKSRLVRRHQREKVDQEVEIMQEVSGHRNVVSYYRSFEDEASICILLELCNKKSLAQYLRRKQHLSEQEVCGIAKQIVDGLTHLHGKGVIHRDLKLGNILLTDDMTVKIGDFGLAARIEAGKKKTICGTPNFIAPEVLQRQGHGTESDVWALGCLFYTLLVGKPPFETASLRDTYRCILKNSYRIPATVSSEAADLVKSMLRSRPKARPTVEEIKSHAFFTKHSAYLESVEAARRPSRVSSSVASSHFAADSTIIRNRGCDDSVSLQATSNPVEKTIVDGKTARVRDLDNICDEEKALSNSVARTKTTEAAGTKSPVRRIASRLQKQLSKMPSPGKCVRAAASNLKDNKKASSAPQSPARNPAQQDVAAPAAYVASDKSGPTTWVSKWVDYSNRYGFGYQLADGRTCVLFNDGTHLSCLPGGNAMVYMDKDESPPCWFFLEDGIPEECERYVKMLHSFQSYMNRNLSRNQSMPSATQEDNVTRLMTWHRTDEYVAMYLSDGTLQINFCKDHVKISIANLHRQSSMRLTVVDQDRNMTTYSGRELASSAMDSRSVSRLWTIHDLFHQMFADVECDAHPFCQVCHACFTASDQQDLPATAV